MAFSAQKLLVNKKVIIAHVAAWFVFLLYDNLYNFLFIDELKEQHRVKAELLYSFAEIGASIIIFYTLLFCWKLYFDKKKKSALTGIITTFFFSCILSFLGMKLLIYLKLGNDFAEQEYLRLLLLGSLQFFIPFLLYALAYVFAMNNISKQQQIIVLREENTRAKTKSKEKELQNVLLQNAFLRAQINPHFLYNTLNFFYAQALPYSNNLAEGILTLSEIMRYALNQPLNSNDTVPLTDEIDHIEKIIKMNRLRFNNNIFVLFEVKGNLEGVYIVPLILITLIENVFKHGEINNPNEPATVQITVTGVDINLYCHNKIRGGIKEPGTGIGLENTKQRLEYEYGTNFSLKSINKDGYNTTEMYINLRPDKNLIT